VVDEGPYAWVRHPGYWYRIRVEEALLRAELGEAYETYAERTPYRLVPGIR